MRRASTALLGLVALASLLTPAAAPAAYDDVGSGATRLVLGSRLLSLLERNGVKLSVRAPARLQKNVVSFPAVDGKLDSLAGRATVEHDGELVLRARQGAVSLASLQLKTTRGGAPLAAKLGGGQLKLGTGAPGRLTRSGFGAKFKAGPLRLAPKVAARLDKRLHLEFPVGREMLLGTVSSQVQPAAVSVLGRERATLELDPGFAAALDRLHVAANPIFPAERPGPFTFPILGGRLAPDLSTGALELGGGLELQKQGGGQVRWLDPRLDLDSGVLLPEAEVNPSPPYGGTLGPIPVAALSRTGATVSADPLRRAISLGGGVVTLSAAGAAALDEVFAKPQGQEHVFVAGGPVGRVSFTAIGR